MRFTRTIQQLLCLFCISTAAVLPVQAAQDDGITRIGVMLYDGILTSDVTAPMEVFGAAIASDAVSNYELVTVGMQAGTVRTQEGLTLYAEYSIANAPELDVIIVGSRYGMDAVLDNQSFMDFIRERGARASWLASNCSGAYILAAAGFLSGRKATTYPGGEVWLKLNHPSIDIEIDETVVVDGNIVTSNGSLISYEAALTLLRLMAGSDKQQEIADLLYYNRLLAKNAAQ
jgi:transcriptional regulator GlxA family with amidase domain